jgi:hypothetical protein
LKQDNFAFSLDKKKELMEFYEASMGLDTSYYILRPNLILSSKKCQPNLRLGWTGI